MRGLARLAVLTLIAACAAALAAAQAPSAPASRANAPDRRQLLADAKTALEQDRPAEAARLLRAAAERFDSVEALLQLARLQSSRKDAAGAFQSLSRARELAPNSEEVLAAYGQVALAAHQPAPAILALEPLTRFCSDVAQYHYLFGVALLQAGDMPAAAGALVEAQRLEPDRPLTLIALGIALNNRKMYAQAKPHLARALELEPDNVEAIATLAETEEGLSELERAEQLALRALSREPRHATASLVLGLVRMRQQRYAEARDALLTAVAVNPGSAKAQYQLSLAYSRLGDTTSAQEHVEKYRQALQDTEERVKKLRSQTGLGGGGGMQP